MSKKSIDQRLLVNLSQSLTDLWENSLVERDTNGIYHVPELNRTLPTMSTPAQATTQFTNLKQNQRFKQKLVPSPAGHLQIAVHGNFFKKNDGGAIVKGNTLDTAHRTTYAKPWSIDIDGQGNIINKDLGRLNDNELEAVEYNLVVRNKHNFTLQPGQVAGQLHEFAKTTHHTANKKDQDTDRQTADPLNYHGTDPAIRSLLFKAAQEVGPKQNHLETLLAFLSRKEEEHQGMIDNLSAENEQQRAEIKGLIQQIENLVTDIREKEKRFQDFNQQVAQQSDMTVQQQAKAAQAQAQSQAAQQPVAQAAQQPAPASNVVPMRAKRQQPTAANVAQYRQAAESVQGSIEQALLEGLANHLGELWEGAFKNIDIDRQEQGHTAIFEVGRYKDGFWIPLQHHASQEQAQFHAKSLKKKYPSMEVGIKGQDGQVKLVGL
jgi:chemotaxis protein histidine kinase CheA